MTMCPTTITHKVEVVFLDLFTWYFLVTLVNRSVIQLFWGNQNNVAEVW